MEREENVVSINTTLPPIDALENMMFVVVVEL
jgi:hypothetical protein